MSEFTPYGQALEMEELGYNKPCFAYATKEYKDVVHIGIGFKIHKESDLPTKPFGVPTWQSAFSWFRENFGLDSFCRQTLFNGKSYWKISKIETDEKIKGYSKFTDSFEEAQLECLKKLIEIVKQKS